MFLFVFAAAIGAAIVYFLNPSKGGRSSDVSSFTSSASQAGSQAFGAIKDKVPEVANAAVSAKEAAKTAAAQAGKAHQHDNNAPDDNTLRDRVESEIFATDETSRENINIDVFNGVVTVRGQLPQQSEIDALVKRIEAVRNVSGVNNLLHLPGTVAPNKEGAVEA